MDAKTIFKILLGASGIYVGVSESPLFGVIFLALALFYY